MNCSSMDGEDNFPLSKYDPEEVLRLFLNWELVFYELSQVY